MQLSEPAASEQVTREKRQEDVAPTVAPFPPLGDLWQPRLESLRGDSRLYPLLGARFCPHHEPTFRGGRLCPRCRTVSHGYTSAWSVTVAPGQKTNLEFTRDLTCAILSPRLRFPAAIARSPT